MFKQERNKEQCDLGGGSPGFLFDPREPFVTFILFLKQISDV